MTVYTFDSSQQRAFAVQVFELHRLIKVQKLIAASPHLLVEDSAYFGKPIITLPVKKLPLEYAVKAIPNLFKQKGDSEKPSHEKECSAENTVEKESSSAQNGVCKPLSGNSPAPSIPSGDDHNAKKLCFNQPQGHQWLIPVMSPSEGLVYKPYPGPGFVGQAYGGCGPPGSNPMMGNFLTPAYGIPAPPPQYPLPSFPPYGSHGYFPPYMMPMMNAAAFSDSSVEQTKPPQAMPAAGQANFSQHHHNLFTMPNQTNRAVPDARNSCACEDIEMQASTASSASERRPGNRASSALEGRNMLPLFPTSPAIDASKSSHRLPVPVPVRPTRVIKVVPHDGLSASESAARIFQSIQEERRQCDSL